MWRKQNQLCSTFKTTGFKYFQESQVIPKNTALTDNKTIVERTQNFNTHYHLPFEIKYPHVVSESQELHSKQLLDMLPLDKAERIWDVAMAIRVGYPSPPTHKRQLSYCQLWSQFYDLNTNPMLRKKSCHKLSRKPTAPIICMAWWTFN